MVNSTFFLLGTAAFGAGFIDACAGGGGLIQLPALLIVFGDTYSIPTLLGTNKFASFAGTSSAVYQYVRHVSLQWKSIGAMAIAACVGSLFGAMSANRLNPALFKPLIIFLLCCSILYTAMNKKMGIEHKPRLTNRQALFYGTASGFVIGFYDGFFGPGTGSFLLLLFIALYGYNFIAANAGTKIVNACTNAVALAYFASTGNVAYSTGLLMAVFNIIGNSVGARLAILKGSLFVRNMYFGVVTLLIVKLVIDFL